MAIITTVLTAVISWTDTGNPFNWALIWKAALAGTCAYLIKNWLTNSQDQILKKEPEQ